MVPTENNPGVTAPKEKGCKHGHGGSWWRKVVSEWHRLGGLPLLCLPALQGLCACMGAEVRGKAPQIRL